ncbi:molybdopterin cofactor-binding domain-containing protein [Janibacter sp. G1551]|uniref:xanthine dehydrogenase family protein molybdopterin-binding subunit n=1 Tax=Janibacter sp. G1551 TaxID=3420440 RepID=UPI003D014020
MPTAASAAIPSLPDTVEILDVADVLNLAATPTMGLLVLEVGADGRARLELPRLEMGQGIATACGMLVAEELDLPMSKVDVPLSDARPELLFNMYTGGSSTMRIFYEPLRRMAASARAKLIGAAANRWDLSAGELETRDGTVVAPDGRTLGYGELAEEAASVSAFGARPKAAGDFKVIGHPAGRLDALSIVTGKKQYTMDLRVPDAMPTMVRRPPTSRGVLVSINNKAAVEKMPGVIGVVAIPESNGIVRIPPGVAVMARTFGQARDGVAALDVTWGGGVIDGHSNETLNARLRSALPPLLVPKLGAKVVEGEFTWAPAAHAPMETECAIADVRNDSAEIWGSFQIPIVAMQTIADEIGLPQNKVRLHVVPAGTGLGRKAFWDAASQAAQVSKALGRPAKLMYHRADDMRHTRLRPPQVHRVRASMLGGQVLSYEHHVASIELDLRIGLGEILSQTAMAMPGGLRNAIGDRVYDTATFLTMVNSPYNFGVSTKLFWPVAIPMDVTAYRSVHSQPTRGVEEVMANEMAMALNKDEVDFRLTFLRNERYKEVVRRVAKAAQWGKKMPAGHAQGFGFHAESRSTAACVVELDARNPKHPRVTKATVVVDVGKPVNPLGIKAQMEGGIAEAIALTLKAGVHLVNGLPLEGSYSQYHWTRHSDYPREVEIIVMPDSGHPIGGVGEVGMTAPTGAIVNAFTRVTGIRPRNFPINFDVDFTPFPPGAVPPPAY